MYSNFYCIVLILVSFAVVDNLETTLAQFELKSLHWIPQNSFTTDLYSKSAKLCALFCVLNEQCAIASYSEVARACRIDHSGKCFFLIEPVNGWAVVKRKGPLEIFFTGCTTDGPSMYRIFDDNVSWITAKGNCEGLGGKLAEIETYEENEFIKNEVRTKDTGVFGYWLGGYNVNQDSDMEWISNPGQVMPFDDMYPGEPNNPSASLCMGTWKVYDYKWGDYGCGTTISYICEF